MNIEKLNIEKIVHVLGEQLVPEESFGISPGTTDRVREIAAYRKRREQVYRDPNRIAVNGVIYRIRGTSKREILRALKRLRELARDAVYTDEAMYSKVLKYLYKGRFSEFRREYGTVYYITVNGETGAQKLLVPPAWCYNEQKLRELVESITGKRIQAIAAYWIGMSPEYFVPKTFREIIEKQGTVKEYRNAVGARARELRYGKIGINQVYSYVYETWITDNIELFYP